MSYKIKTPSQIETAKKKAENLKSSLYLQGSKKNDFVNWLYKKYKYGKFELNQSEKDILISLDRIKKIDRVAGFRVFQFISGVQNKSFYLILDGFGGSIKTVKNYIKGGAL
jgi:hypothetical protein